MNTIIVSGNLGNNPEIKTKAQGKDLATFSLAYQITKEKTGWIKIQCWNKLAKTVEEYLSRGDKILIEGSLDYSTWEKDGKNQSKTDVIARRIEFIKVKGHKVSKEKDDIDRLFTLVDKASRNAVRNC